MATDKNIKVVINGEDKTKGAISSASKGIKSLTTDVTGLSKVLGGTALTAVASLGAFLVSSAKSAAQAEVQMAKVTATLTSMGESALKNRDAILKASEASIKLGFDDEDTALSITRLYQRTNDLTEAQKLSNLAMDLARAKSIDLETATNLVGQALSGNGKVLAQYGIDIKDTATPLEALGELHDKVGGQAEAFANTFEGQMTILQESVGNLKETIGASLLEAINPLIKTFTDWATKDETQQKIKEISILLGELAKEWIPIAVEAFKILWEWGTKIYEVMVKVGNAIISAIEAYSNFSNKLDNTKFGKGVSSGGGLLGGVKAVLSGQRADGGSVIGGNSYLVGERGPEIFTASSSGFIKPNLAGASGNNITINITGNSLLDETAGAKIARQVMDALKSNLRI